MGQLIAVRHNIEVAHRLFETPGRCENIHGHSMDVTLKLSGSVDSHGLLGGVDFGGIKSAFRGYLDEHFDHRLLLNGDDPWAGPLVHSFEHDLVSADPSTGKLDSLPGLKCLPGDPTTENLARWIGEACKVMFEGSVRVFEVGIWETAVNFASWRPDD